MTPSLASRFRLPVIVWLSPGDSGTRSSPGTNRDGIIFIVDFAVLFDLILSQCEDYIADLAHIIIAHKNFLSCF